MIYMLEEMRSDYGIYSSVISTKLSLHCVIQKTKNNKKENAFFWKL